MVASLGGKPKKRFCFQLWPFFLSRNTIVLGNERVRKAQVTDHTLLSLEKEKTESWFLANCTRIEIGFMKNKNYIKLLFKKKFTFMNKYSLGYTRSSGKGRTEVTFAKSPSNA